MGENFNLNDLFGQNCLLKFLFQVQFLLDVPDFCRVQHPPHFDWFQSQMHILCFRYPVWTATPSRNIILLRATSLSWLQAGGWHASKIIKICIDNVEMDQNHSKPMKYHLRGNEHAFNQVCPLCWGSRWLWWILFTQASQYLDRKHGSNVILSHNREFQTQLPECETPAGAEYILLNWV